MIDGVDWSSSKIVPKLLTPPPVVTPNRLPLLSCTRPPEGFEPLLPLNDATATMVLLPCGSSNTVPSLLAPPLVVIPKRLPLLSWTKLAEGFAPLGPLKKPSG